MEKKILVAIDGSIYSSNSLDYLIRLFRCSTDLAIHLLSIVPPGETDQGWMLEVDPLRSKSPDMERRISRASRYLRDARDRLIRNGFSEDRITFSVESTGGGIAAAIHQQAASGLFDSLLIGRRGVGKVGEMFFGSVSADLIRTCHETPLWIIDGEVTSSRFLLAIHVMPDSLQAADHLGYMLASSQDAVVYLYHSRSLFRDRPKEPPERFHARWGKAWCEKHLDLDNHLFNAHTRILLENGLRNEQIIQLEPGRDLEVSHDLLRRARKHSCGTIVLGRRGPEVRKRLLLGGVSDRTMQQAQNLALWLVG